MGDLGCCVTPVQRALLGEVIAGVYAINYGEAVYVGEARDIFARGTYAFAERLDLPRGIVAEMPQSTRKQRMVEEERVAAVFARRGFNVVSDVASSPRRAALVSAALRGKPKTAEHRARLSAARKEMFARSPEVLEEHRKRTRERNAARRGIPRSDETKAKIRAAQLGKKASPETLAKMRAARLGEGTSAETRAKMSAALRGRKQAPRSAEHRARISAAAKRRWERWRLERRNTQGRAA